MSNQDQLAIIGQKLTAALSSSYSNADPDAALVFLPGGVTVPNNLVQQGMVNPAQMQTYMEINFDAPFLMSPSECAVHGKDISHGSARQIYEFAATSAQPLGTAKDDSYKRVTAEIAMARRNLGPSNMPGGLVCMPDDWALPSNDSYWTTFDSSVTLTDTPNTPDTPDTPNKALPKVLINSKVWAIRSQTMAVAQPLMAMKAASQPAGEAAADGSSKPNLSESLNRLVQHPVVNQARMLLSNPSVLQQLHLTDDDNQKSDADKKNTPPPPPVSTIKVQLQHQCVTVGYLLNGASWWNATFLTDKSWYIPGMDRGGLLPMPEATMNDANLAYGIPVALIVVKGLTVSGNWSNEAAAALSAPGSSLGPFSLQGATTTQDSTGSITYSRPGMQVIALLCSQLPVLPPVNDPASAVADNATPADTPAANTATANTATDPQPTSDVSQ